MKYEIDFQVDTMTGLTFDAVQTSTNKTKGFRMLKQNLYWNMLKDVHSM